MKKISIIVPVYNVEKYLGRCVESIIAQTYKEWELILIDDGSSDLSGKICDSYAESDSRIKVIHQTNMGVSQARNAGLNVYSGDYISFVDSDDWLNEDMYMDLINNIQKFDADFGVCDNNNITFENGMMVSERRYIWRYEKPTLVKGEDMFYDIFNKTGTLWNKIFKSSLVGDKRFDTNMTYGEDVQFLMYLTNDASSAVIVPTAGYNYFIDRGGNVVSAKINESSIEYIKNTVKQYKWLSSKKIPSVGISRLYMVIGDVLNKIPLDDVKNHKRYIEACKKAARTPSLSDLFSFMRCKKIKRYKYKIYIISYIYPEIYLWRRKKKYKNKVTERDNGN